MSRNLYVGMDVHKDSVMIAVLRKVRGSRMERLPNDVKKLQRFFDRIGRKGRIRPCYEARINHQGGQ